MLLRASLPVGVLATTISTLSLRETSSPITDPIHLGAAILGTVQGSPYVRVELGLLHLAFLVGAALLTALLAVALTSNPTRRSAFGSGAVVGLMNALAIAPGAAQAGGLTGLLFWAPASVLDVVLLGTLTSSFVVMSRRYK